MKTQITYGSYDFIVEDMTDEEKEILKAEKPEIFKQHIKTDKKNNKQSKK